MYQKVIKYKQKYQNLLQGGGNIRVGYVILSDFDIVNTFISTNLKDVDIEWIDLLSDKRLSYETTLSCDKIVIFIRTATPRYIETLKDANFLTNTLPIFIRLHESNKPIICVFIRKALILTVLKDAITNDWIKSKSLAIPPTGSWLESKSLYELAFNNDIPPYTISSYSTTDRDNLITELKNTSASNSIPYPVNFNELSNSFITEDYKRYIQIYTNKKIPKIVYPDYIAPRVTNEINNTILPI